MRSEYENAVYVVGALTVVIERNDADEEERQLMIAARAVWLRRVESLLASESQGLVAA